MLQDADAAAPAAPFCFHPHDMRIDEKGVHPCFWPVPLEELESARDRFLAELFAWFRAENVDRNPNAELFWLNAATIGMEFTRLFHGWVVLQRLQGADRPEWQSLRDDGLFTSLAAGRAPAPPIYSAGAMAGLPEDPLWRKVLRAARYALRPDKTCYRPPALISRDEDVVTFSMHELIAAHARQSGRRLVVSKFPDWMTTGDITHLEPGHGASPASREAIIALMRRRFAEAECIMPDFLVRHCDQFLERLTARTQVYLHDLMDREKHLPKRFWSGSSGILYNRVMARAVQRAGGKTTGHDHSSSSGWWRTPLRTVIELNYVDRFMTYGEAIAEHLRRDVEPTLFGRAGQEVEITGLAASARPTAPRASEGQGRPTATGRKLMYVMTAYTGNFVGLWTVMPDLVAVDWQARLLAHLHARGHDLSLKPNPDSPCAPPPAFEALFNAPAVEGACEALMPQADILLFDYPASTCFLAALRTDRPIVLIDFPFVKLDPEARALLARRVALVPGRLDGSGRAWVDWDELDTALATAPALEDDTFVENYFPSL